MKSPVIKRSIVIAGHKTSVSLEDAFWQGLKDIAAARDMTLSELVATIDTDRRHGNLSSGIRLFVLDHYRSKVEYAHKEESSGLNEISVYADETTWAAAVSAYPGACFYLRLDSGRDDPLYGVGTTCTAREALASRDSLW